ncbi:MAG TPA: lysophospholipid acyltransferase family protein [Candidatus Saccharimonadales bacterium]|nr:lysophospholipid acyltransferase family protein [Candidatus Saccharimonadales bacterium]
MAPDAGNNRQAEISPHGDSASAPEATAGPETVNAHYDTRLPTLKWSRRIQIPVIAAAVYSVIRTIGPTLRYEVLGWQHAEEVYANGQRCIWSFWHRVIIPVAWWARNRGIVVMNTTAFDGQWTRKVIEWLGFNTAQGSSSRGGLRGLAVMARRLAEGLDCAFTIDGPRGPRYVAKPGPVMLARKTGCPILVFHVGCDRGKTLEKTWDHFLLPKLFARTVMIFAPPIFVPKDADAELLEAKHGEMQRELERVRDLAESWFSLTESERQSHRGKLENENFALR